MLAIHTQDSQGMYSTQTVEKRVIYQSKIEAILKLKVMKEENVLPSEQQQIGFEM